MERVVAIWGKFPNNPQFCYQAPIDWFSMLRFTFLKQNYNKAV